MQDFLLSIYPWLKGFHIAAVIFWMAGMLYLPRLFVYHHQAQPEGELEGALLIQERNLLKIIINPSMIAVWLLAILMMVANPTLFTQGWFHVKLLCVVLLTGYTYACQAWYKKFAVDENKKSEKFFRIVNEIPAALMVIIVIMVVAKPF